MNHDFSKDFVLRDALKQEPLPWLEQLKLLKKAKDGDRQAREKIISTNLRIVLMCVSRFKMSPVDPEELFSAGLEGMNHAIDKFKPTVGCKFTTYAVWWINSRIKTAVYENHSLVRNGSKSSKAMAAFWSNSNKSFPTAISLHATVGVDSEFGDFIEDEGPTPEEAAITADLANQAKSTIEDLLRTKLTTQEAFIIRERILSKEPKTFEEIADMYQLSRERIRQVQNRALDKLARALISKLGHKQVLEVLGPPSTW